ASDHSPCPPAMKETSDIWSAWGGLAGIQTMLSVMLTEAVHRRTVPLPRIVQLLCTNPSRRLGLYPRKGVLQPGSDADIAVIDLDREFTVRTDDLLTRWPVNPFIGRALRGRVLATFVRGTPVFRNGSICAT